MKMASLVVSLLGTPLLAQTETSDMLPPSVSFMEMTSEKSHIPGVYLACELYIDHVGSTAVFYKACRVKRGGTSIVMITSYERDTEEVVIWTAPGYTIE